MNDIITRDAVAHIVKPRDVEVFDVLGPKVEFLTPPEGSEPCVMRGTIPPGVSVPLHTHADPETFIMISGEVEGLAHSEDIFEWVRIRPADVFHVPGGVKHAFRNQGDAPAVMFMVSTSKIGRFFQEIGTPAISRVGPGEPPSGEVIERFLRTSERYGYWNASPEENAAIGIKLPFG